MNMHTFSDIKFDFARFGWVTAKNRISMVPTFVFKSFQKWVCCGLKIKCYGLKYVGCFVHNIEAAMWIPPNLGLSQFKTVFGHAKFLPLNGVYFHAYFGQWGHFSPPNGLTPKLKLTRHLVCTTLQLTKLSNHFGTE